MGQVLHLGPSWHGPSFMWAEMAWPEFVLGRAVLHLLSTRTLANSMDSTLDYRIMADFPE